MKTVPEIEAAVRELSHSDLSAFRKWFEEFDAEQWDRRLEEDIKSGKLNSLANETINDLREGRCTDL